MFTYLSELYGWSWYARRRSPPRQKIQTRAFFCAELLILEPGSIRKGADSENGVKIALVELCQHLLYGRVV
jgi:hypothetical protein